LTERTDTPSIEQGLRALKAAARLGAPGRMAQHAIVRAVERGGGTVDQALGHLEPLLQGGEVEYQTRLQIAREYVRAGQLDRAETAFADAGRAGSDPQLALLQGLLLLARDEDAAAEVALAGAVAGLRDESLPLPDGDDPRFWLAAVQARQGEHADAVATARAGLNALPAEQASLRVPYRHLLGDSLLALGRAEEAVPIYEAGLRLAPGDARLRDGLARARQMLAR
jgi:tetratricopeptide (TPR) repeat protein